jgi:hypothetical protein
MLLILNISVSPDKVKRIFVLVAAAGTAATSPD